MLNFVSLFSGIGALDYGLECAGLRCVYQVEIEPFCRAVLQKHWPHVRRGSDIRDFTGSELDEPTDVVCGGFPCQPVSVAGKGLAQADARWLWPEMLRVIRSLRPNWVLAENVPGLRNRGADIVLADLEAENYTCWPVVVGAENVGAPHRRHRVWIVGKLADAGSGPVRDGGCAANASATGEVPEEVRQQRIRLDAGAEASGDGLDDATGSRLTRHAADERGENMADANGSGLGESGGAVSVSPEHAAAQRGGAYCWPARPGERQHEWEHPRLITIDEGAVKRCLGSTVDGASARLVRAARFHNRSTLKAVGNAVVWVIPYLIGKWIIDASPLPAAEVAEVRR